MKVLQANRTHAAKGARPLDSFRLLEDLERCRDGAAGGRKLDEAGEQARDPARRDKYAERALGVDGRRERKANSGGQCVPLVAEKSSVGSLHG